MRVLYTASTLALAALEYLVHVDPDDVPADLVAMELTVPGGGAVTIESLRSLPPDWRAAVAPDACRQAGANWVRSGRSLGLTVPSVIIPGERNLLLNPAHSAMADVLVRSVSPFQFDPRLLYRV